MSAAPKTIQIFLPGGDPRGIRVAEITTRIVQVIEVPRSLLQDFLKTSESEQVAVYFLFGESDDSGQQKVYIGQTGDLQARLAAHNKQKDFWERALVLISRTNSLTQTHALFLEWHCLQAARKAGRYADENSNGGSKPHTPAPLQADCLEIFETGQALLSTLGYPLFDPVVRITPKVASVNLAASSDAPNNLPDIGEPIFFCETLGGKAQGVYTPEGFVVLAGSMGRLVGAPHFATHYAEGIRAKLLESGVTRAEGKSIIFTRDHLFRSPSLASSVVLGRASSGWKEWKTAEGLSLDAVKRQS